MNIDLEKYDEKHATYIEALTKRLDSIYASIIRQAVKYGLSVNFDPDAGEIFDFSKFPNLKKKIDDLFNDMHNQIHTLVLNGINDEWLFSGEKNDYFLSEILSYGEASEKQIETILSMNNAAIQERRSQAQKAFAERVQNGMNLSDRIWKLTDQFKSELEMAIDIGLSQGKSAQQISRDIRSYLVNPDKLFRRVRDKHGNLKLSKAAAAYHPGQGVYRSSYKNAMRVARTEVNMAYRSADYTNWSLEKMVLGIRIRLSNNHTLNGEPFFDICDELKGDYPQDFKFTGWHPQCRCWAVPITPKQDEVIEYTRKIIAGEDVSDFRFTGQVEEMPKVFKVWYAKNAGRVARMKNKPYFIADNENIISSMGKKQEKKQEVKQEIISSNLDGILSSLSQAGVKHNPVKLLEKELQEEEIIERLGGGDLTKGSCSSLAFAYLGNKCGFDVLDFRDGSSREMFSRVFIIKEITKSIGGVIAENTSDYKNAEELLKNVVKGKEYYFTCGSHAAVVRKSEEGYEFLELQSSSSNGFKSLDKTMLKWRFAAKKSHSTYGYKYKATDCLIDIDLLRKDGKFREMLGYINTPEDEQRKGSRGTIK